MLALWRNTAIGTAAVLTAIGVVVARPTGAQVAPEPATQESKQYEVVTKGLLGSPLFPIQFRSADLRVEIRNLVMGRGEAQAVPTPTRTIMELRGGAVVTTINGDKRERRAGDFWEVEKGSMLALENRGEVAVIRAIYLFEGGK